MNKAMKFLILTLSSLLAAFVIYGDKAHAQSIPGAPTSQFPDTSIAGEGPSYMVNELCSGPDNCMRSKITVAKIYVPISLRNQDIGINIYDGCDNTGNDFNGGSVSTKYRMLRVAGTADSETGNGCKPGGNGHVRFVFRATPTGLVKDMFGSSYDTYYFIGDAVGPNDTDGIYSYNFYRLHAEDTNIRIGISNYAPGCSVSKYPYSCPTSGSAYSSFGQTKVSGQANGGNYSQQVEVSGCSIRMYGQLDIYDLDDGIYGQNNITGTLDIYNSGGGLISSGTQKFSGLPASMVGNDGHLYLPNPSNASQAFTFEPGNRYVLRISGLTRTNTIQINVRFTTDDPSNDSNCGVIEGPAPTCSINNVRTLWGSTEIRPSDPILFDVTVQNAQGYKLAVNGESWGDEYPGTNIHNYLVSGFSYARGSPAGSPPGWRDLWDGTYTIDDLVMNNDDNPGTPSQYIYAPGSYGTYAFNWGLVLPGGSPPWHPVTCDWVLDLQPILPKVEVDNYNCNSFGGWAYDGDHPTWNLPGYVYWRVPGGGWNYYAYIEASGSGGTANRFSVTVPETLKNTNAYEWTIDFYGWNSGGGSEGYVSSGIFTVGPCDTLPTASFTDWDCNILKGKASDPDKPGWGLVGYLYVRYSGVGWTYLGRLDSDTSGNFSYNIPPQYRDARAYEWTIDYFGWKPNGIQAGYVSSGVVSIGPCNVAPVGNIDISSCSQGIQGWGLDKSAPSSQTLIGFFENNVWPITGSVNTTILRTDVNTTYGVSGNHGFSWPLPASLKDGSSHDIYVYVWGLDNAGNYDGSVVYIGARTVQCVDAASCTVSLTNVAGTTYPNSQYLATFRVTNTGSSSWDPAQGNWDLASHSSVTNNYLTNAGSSSAFALIDIPSVVPPGSTVTLTYQTGLPGGPSYGTTHPFNWSMVHWGYRWFGAQCIMSVSTISGRVADAFNTSIPRSAVINTCGWGNISSNGSVNGSFSFAVPQGSGFCVEATNVTPGADNVYVRPWNEGYRACAGYGYGDSANSLKCYSSTFYGSQGFNSSGVLVTTPDQYAGTARNDGFDRSQDWGYDLAPAWKPVVTCTIKPQTGLEVGVTYEPEVIVYNGVAAGTAPGITGSVSHFINGGERSDGSINPALPIGSNRSIKTSPARSFASPTTYPVTASTAWVGGPWSESVRCPDSTAGASELPYIKMYGGDVWAGGTFGTGTCTASNSGIFTIAKGSGSSYQGSSAQFNVTAIGRIDQLFSASNKITSNQPPKDLTFANSASSETYGGNLGGNGVCITDYFESTKKNPVPNTGNLTSAIASSANGKNQFAANGDNYNGAQIPKGKQIVVYMTGNVFIDKDIIYDNSARSSVNDIPFFAMIVKGNIKIGKDVKQLDGLYVAQPTDATSNDGKIYTCAPSAAGTYTGTELYGNCKKQLSINGGLVAKQVKFLRTIFSLKDSTVNNNSAQGEIPNFADGSGTGNGANTKAAEIINYTPEFYLAPSPLKDPTSTSEQKFDKYDAITSLPPVF